VRERIAVMIPSESQMSSFWNSGETILKKWQFIGGIAKDSSG
jgi:hypothetical protein